MSTSWSTELREANGGDLPALAWPGFYPIYYVADDGGTICASCANDPTNPIHVEGEPDGWRLDGYVVYYEGEPETCDHCGATIESAYGVPEGSPSTDN
jgi:hypothetical protein